MVIQRHPPQWFDALVPSVGREDIYYTVGAIDRDGPSLTTTIHCQVEHHRWTYNLIARRLSDDKVAVILTSVSNFRWLHRRSFLAHLSHRLARRNSWATIDKPRPDGTRSGQ